MPIVSCVNFMEFILADRYNKIGYREGNMEIK